MSLLDQPTYFKLLTYHMAGTDHGKDSFTVGSQLSDGRDHVLPSDLSRRVPYLAQQGYLLCRF
ncbi:MAG: hypothetical protein AAGG48_16860 [Planctomycetota bacterium]